MTEWGVIGSRFNYVSIFMSHGKSEIRKYISDLFINTPPIGNFFFGIVFIDNIFME